MEKPVKCPCCNKDIFTVAPVQEGVPVLGSKGLELQHDQHGSFMKCPHCSKRVIFVSEPSLVGIGFRVGDIQPCADCQ